MIWIATAMILAAVAFLAWAGRYLISEILRGKRPGPLPIAALAGLTIGGVWLGASGGADIRHGYQRRAWPKVEATITHSILRTSQRDYTAPAPGEIAQHTPTVAHPGRLERWRQRNLRPEITYTYTVDGTSYTGITDMDVPGFGGTLNRLDVAVKTLAAHPEGHTFTAYYNPASPGESWLHPGPAWNAFGFLGLGVLLAGLGLGGLWQAARPRQPRS